MMINSYDIDGNDAVGSNQFSEFGGFSTSEVSTTTTLTTSYNPSTNLTRFGSSIYTNVVDASDPNTRVRVSYEEMSIFRISVGSQGAGPAYFFIDFDKGVDFTIPTKVTTAPTVDLNTTSGGNNNASSQCSSGNTKFTAGGQNIATVASTPSGGTTLERLKLTFNTTDIKDGSSERLVISGAGSGSPIQLNFSNGASIGSVVLTGTTYAVSAIVANGESSLIFTKSGSTTMTRAEGEKLLDAFYYGNTASSRTNGARTFEVRVKDGAYESAAYTYTVTVGNTPTISQQPQSATIAVNTNTSFQANGTGTSWQWQVNPGTGTWSNITNNATYSGATTNNLTITNAPATMNNYQFRAINTATVCNATTNIATLGVLAVLPVTWLNVTANMQQNGIAIKWGTSQEMKVIRFIVQVSTDGKSFADAGTVAAAGTINSNSYYSFMDANPAGGVNYYRIKELDADGNFSYSKIVSVTFNTSAEVLVFGNPVSNGQLVVQVNQSMPLTLFSADGKRVKHQLATAGTQSLDVRGLSRGIYTLLAGTSAKRIVINN